MRSPAPRPGNSRRRSCASATRPARCNQRILATGKIIGAAKGHEAIRGTHRKTLELTREPLIGSGATCVVAVGAALDELAVAGLRGRVELTIEAGGLRDSVRGRLNPAFRPGDPLIVRRDPSVTRDAVIIDADGSAATLSRELISELATPGTRVQVSIREIGGPAPGALLVDPGAPWSLRCPIDVQPVELDLSSPLEAWQAERALLALSRCERVLLRAEILRDKRAVALVAAAHDAGHAVLPVPGLPPLAAALALAGVSLDRVTVSTASCKPAALSERECRAIVAVPGDGVERWLEGAERGLVALDVGGRRERYLAWRAGEPLTVPGGRRRSAIVVAGAAPSVKRGEDEPAGVPEPSAELPSSVVALTRELLRNGVPTRQLAVAVREATGLSRREAYEALLTIEQGA